MAPKRGTKKRLGKKHRQASTRPKLGRAPKTGAQVAGATPKKRKELAAKKAAAAKAKLTPTRSPENERRITLRNADEGGRRNAGPPLRSGMTERKVCRRVALAVAMKSASGVRRRHLRKN